MEFSQGVSVLTVFAQGLLSFFSPCVLPLIPLYIGYLAGGTKTTDEQGRIHYNRKTVLVNTLFFILGISFTFFALGFGFTALGRALSDSRQIIAVVGGALIVLLGIFQLGFFGNSMFKKEHRFLPHFNQASTGPLTALLLGFTFSFAWTPCVGPALTSVLLMSSASETAAYGFLLIGVYALGFVLPFLAVGLFTSAILDFFKKHTKVVKYTIKAGAVLLIIMGILMMTGLMNGLTGFLSGSGGLSQSSSSSQNQSSSSLSASSSQSASSSAPPAASSSAPPAASSSAPPAASSSAPPAASSSAPPAASSSVPPGNAPAFTLTDQFGASHSLSQYRGKVVFLNFWATWCGYCVQEMPDIQKLYETYEKNSGDVVVLGVAGPGNVENSTVADLTSFLKSRGLSYPTLMDTTGSVFTRQYSVSALPTTVIIDRNGNVLQTVPGMMSYSMMNSLIQNALN